jgi:hypothetical protein
MADEPNKLKWFENRTALLASARWLLAMFAGWASIGFAAMVDEWARELGQAIFILLTGAAIFVVARGQPGVPVHRWSADRWERVVRPSAGCGHRRRKALSATRPPYLAMRCADIK